MVKAVFTTKVNPTYDDLPEVRYHFPRTYLRVAEQAIGDWIVYYEPRRTSGNLSSRGGRQSYFASARVTSIEPDPSRPDHYYAKITDFLEFDRPVPFKENSHYYESALQRNDGETNRGAFGRAMRSVPDIEYELIVQSGFTSTIDNSADRNMGEGAGFFDEPSTFKRPIIERLIARPFRDAAFTKSVKTAYDNTCAMTGLRIINGGGRAEVQAAHIWPVAEDGPDSVRNGLALSGTIHWMFDRGLVSIDDNYKILIANDRLPDAVKQLLNPDKKLILPPASDLRPHARFLHYHREHIFKG